MEIEQIIALIVIMVTTLFLVFLKVQKDGLKQVAYKLILEAEEKLQNGDEKMEYCINKIITLIPLPFSLFVTKNMVQKLIQNIFDNVKPLLDYQK